VASIAAIISQFRHSESRWGHGPRRFGRDQRQIVPYRTLRDMPREARWWWDALRLGYRDHVINRSSHGSNWQNRPSTPITLSCSDPDCWEVECCDREVWPILLVILCRYIVLVWSQAPSFVKLRHLESGKPESNCKRHLIYPALYHLKTLGRIAPEQMLSSLITTTVDIGSKPAKCYDCRGFLVGMQTQSAENAMDLAQGNASEFQSR
jgi:hypothetical protein